MPIWIEAALGLSAIALCAVACWREDQMVEWEDRVAANKIKRRKEEKLHAGNQIHGTGSIGKARRPR